MHTATAGEYKAQNYEGASTMYGPQQGSVLENLLATVIQTPQPLPGHILKQTYPAGGKLSFGPEYYTKYWHLPYFLSYEDLEPMMPDPTHRPDDGAPRFEWQETDKTDWLIGQRHVRILQNKDGFWAEADNDESVDILTVLVSAWIDNPTGNHYRKWTAIWAPAAADASAPRPYPVDGTYIFRVEPPGQTLVCSEPFHLDKRVDSVPSGPKSQKDCPAWAAPAK